MKKRTLLIVFAIGATILSCSSEEDTNDNNPQQEAPMVAETEQRIFESGSLSERVVTSFENGKPKTWTFFDATGDITFRTDWLYNGSDNLTTINGFLPNGEQSYTLTITYDGSERISEMVRSEQSGSFITTTTFTHNNDNTITAITESDGFESTKTFEVNSDGIIDKEIEDGTEIATVQYDGLKPISKTANSTTYSYTYETNGSNPYAMQSIFGDTPINVVLFQNSLADASDSLTTELISEISTDFGLERFNIL
ncbi:hypothetical protein [Luteirhabdus pelagi]|uniref:hypothetical protein n=1 Tax=Luteirhabdus pelagi TaxID=2792783 RepID=UPI00193A3E9D|nr:hypothetical protein [Luteirhabdus pelagi]